MIKPELVCPAGTPAALRTAVDAGADSVYCGFQNATNARNFAGLNFTVNEMESSIEYAHSRGAKVLLAINTFPPAGETGLWKNAIDEGIRLGVDAIIIADMGVADYIYKMYPDQRIHLSVQAGASSPDAIKFYCREFNVRRVVLPRILTIEEIRALKDEIPCEIEVFVFGNIGMMAEGRCSLTNYITGLSTNTDGVCSPAGQVDYRESDPGTLKISLGSFTIDCFDCNESAGYPTICKGRYLTDSKNSPYYAFEKPVSLNLSHLLEELVHAGVSALKIEGRQRSRAYIKSVVKSFRSAVDACVTGKQPKLDHLLALTEGHTQTAGAFGGKRWR